MQRSARSDARIHILLLGVNYAPEATGIAPYTAGLAEHLVQQGYRVTMVTGMPSYPDWHIAAGYRGRWRVRESVNGVDVRRLWNYVPGTQSALRRGLYEATFLLHGLTSLTLPRPDLVLGVSPALGGAVLARLAAQRFRVPYGLIIQDLMGPASQQSGLAGGRLSALVGRSEAWAVRGAAQVGIVAEGFRPYLESLGVPRAHIGQIPNWTHVAPATFAADVVRRQLGLGQQARICLHAGNMGHKQGLSNLIDCASLAHDRRADLLFVLMGGGNQKPALERLVSERGLTNVRFLPQQPREFFPNVLAAADVLLINQLGAVTDMALPSKLTAYLVSGRPIVAAVAYQSETARELTASGGGLIVEPDDPEALLAALHRLLEQPDLQARLGAAGKRYAVANLTAAAVLARYDAFVNALAHYGHQTPLPNC